MKAISAETREKVHSKADYILYSLETGGYNLQSLCNALDSIRQNASGIHVDTVVAEWERWMADLRRLQASVRAWNDATITPILEANNGKGILPPEAVPDMLFTAFRETPEGASLYAAMQNDLRVAHAPRELLKTALRELLAATEKTPEK